MHGYSPWCISVTGWSWNKRHMTTQQRVMTLTGDACMLIVDNCIMSSAWKECNMYSAHKAAVKSFRREVHSAFFGPANFIHKGMMTVLTLCIKMRVQRVLRNLSTTPARGLLSTADETGSRWYICVQCYPARSKCEMQLCMEWYKASPALLLNGCSGISEELEHSLSGAGVC